MNAKLEMSQGMGGPLPVRCFRTSVKFILRLLMYLSELRLNVSLAPSVSKSSKDAAMVTSGSSGLNSGVAIISE